MTTQSPQIDNSTFQQKVMLRTTALKQLSNTPVVIETHGGVGDIYSAVYRDVEDGCVFEKDAAKAQGLAFQRPSWAVYEANSTSSLALGAGNHLVANLLDVDPYGDPWPTIKAFLGSERPLAKRMVIVVNDGLGQKVQVNGAWDSSTLEPIVQMWGNNIWGRYLEACEWLMNDAATSVGYSVAFFDGYHCGAFNRMTHYLAVLER